MDTQVIDKPFRHWVIDGLLATDAALATREVARSLAARPDAWLAYDDGVQRKCLVDDPNQVGPATASLLRRLGRPNFIHSLATLTGLGNAGLVTDPSGHGGSVHVLLPGDYLSCHLDRAVHPTMDPVHELRLVLVMFLVPNWEDHWGGHLELYDRDFKVRARCKPAPGRAVVWEAGDYAYHGVGPVTALEDLGPEDGLPPPRATATAFYYAPARPGHTDRRGALFRPRPAATVNG